MCIVCASISCPNVRQEAFRPEKISTQMDDQVRDFLSNEKKGQLCIHKGTHWGVRNKLLLKVKHFCNFSLPSSLRWLQTGFSLDTRSSIAHYSSIFNWFSDDFNSYGGVQNFTYPYLPSSDVAFMQKHDVDTKYFDYNWNLNGVPPCDCSHWAGNKHFWDMDTYSWSCDIFEVTVYTFGFKPV